jgi:predicted nucleic acid-binding protein
MGIGCLRLGAEEWQRALVLGVEKGISFYDAVYIASAEWSGAKLITADGKLFDAASSTVGAVHLKDYI